MRIGWLILILDFSTLGVLEKILPWLVAPILRYDYPFSIAWHGPIIPCTILAGSGLLWLWDRFFEARWGAALYRYAYVILGVLAVILFGVLLFNQQILQLSKGRVGFTGSR